MRRNNMKPTTQSPVAVHASQSWLLYVHRYVAGLHFSATAAAAAVDAARTMTARSFIMSNFGTDFRFNVRVNEEKMITELSSADQ